jgi:hypothetical protein
MSPRTEPQGKGTSKLRRSSTREESRNGRIGQQLASGEWRRRELGVAVEKGRKERVSVLWRSAFIVGDEVVGGGTHASATGGCR